MTKRYWVVLVGCHDSTTLDMELSDEEAALLRRVAELSADASKSACEPEVIIREAK